MSKIVKLLLLALAVKIFVSLFVWHPDVRNHMDWGIRFWEYGPGRFYAPESNVWSFTWPNQPPGTVYIFAGAEKLFEAVFASFWFLNVNIPLFPSNIMLFFETNLYPAFLKLPSILADAGIAYLIYKIFKDQKKEKIGVFGAILFLTNPVIWYNSTIWGQTDAVINFFALLSFYFLLKRTLFLSLIAFLLSLYIKASLLIFAPIFLIVAIKQSYAARRWAVSIVACLGLVLFLTLPFSVNQNPAVYLFEVYQKKVFTEQLQVITANAFNIWAVVTGIHERPHSLTFIIFSYKIWGYFLFALAAIPASFLVWKKQDYRSVFWSLAIISFSSFMFLTNMHERYLYPFFIPATILAAENRKLLPAYWAVAGLNLVNLYNFWWTPKIVPLVDILSAGNRLLPRILGFVNFVLFIWFYRQFKKVK